MKDVPQEITLADGYQIDLLVAVQDKHHGGETRNVHLQAFCDNFRTNSLLINGTKFLLQ